MRKAGRYTPSKKDANHDLIVAALRGVGASIQDLYKVGGGCPDLLVGYKGKNFLIEVKNPNSLSSDKVLRPNQIQWHEDWKGQKVFVVETCQEAVEAIGVALPSITPDVHPTVSVDQERWGDPMKREPSVMAKVGRHSASIE